MQYSYDGKRWSAARTVAKPGIGTTSVSLSKFFFVGAMFFAMFSYGITACSPDGAGWNIVAVPSAGREDAACYVNGKYVFVDSQRIFCSQDLIPAA